MRDLIRIGLVGLGFIGKTHLEAYEKIPNAEVAVICTTKPLKDFKGTVVRHYDELLQNRDIDVVDLCVPTFLHEEYIVKAAQAGKHIICEKPLALSVEAAERIMAEVHRHKVKLLVGHVLRFWPEYVAIREKVDFKVEVIHGERRGQLPTWSDWFQYPEKSGGALYDLHIHDIDFTIFTVGKVETVYAVGTKNKYGAWNHVMTSLSFSNGAKAFLEASHRMPNGYPFTMSYRVQGDDRVIDFNLAAGENIENVEEGHQKLVYYENGKNEPIRVLDGDPFVKELSYFLECIEGKRENDIVPLEDVLYTLQVMEAVEESLQSGKVVKLSI